jgi:hypothetical protein
MIPQAQPVGRVEATRQEQTQMITSAIGTPAATAPPIIIANAESKLGSASTPRLDTTLLREPPRAFARRPRMNDKKYPSEQAFDEFRVKKPARIGRYEVLPSSLTKG